MVWLTMALQSGEDGIGGVVSRGKWMDEFIFNVKKHDKPTVKMMLF